MAGVVSRSANRSALSSGRWEDITWGEQPWRRSRHTAWAVGTCPVPWEVAAQKWFYMPCACSGRSGAGRRGPTVGHGRLRYRPTGVRRAGNQGPRSASRGNSWRATALCPSSKWTGRIPPRAAGHVPWGAHACSAQFRAVGKEPRQVPVRPSCAIEPPAPVPGPTALLGPIPPTADRPLPPVASGEAYHRFTDFRRFPTGFGVSRNHHSRLLFGRSGLPPPGSATDEARANAENRQGHEGTVKSDRCIDSQ